MCPNGRVATWFILAGSGRLAHLLAHRLAHRQPPRSQGRLVSASFRSNMSWTFAHPAFILPLRRLGPLVLSLPALAIGSMMPDLLFYMGLRPLSLVAHTFVGSVLIALPCGLAVLALVTVLRRPLIHLLPQPHRGVLMAAYGGPITWSARAVLVWIVSIQVGSWSHLLIDVFTHAPPPGIGWLHWLSAPLATVAGRVLLVHTVMQVGTSAVAIVVLLVVYRRWLRRQLAAAAPGASPAMAPATAAPVAQLSAVAPVSPVMLVGMEMPTPMTPAGPAGSRASVATGITIGRDPYDDRWRWMLQATLVLGAGLAGLADAVLTAPPITSWRAAEFQVFRLLVMATMIYVPALLLSALIAWRRR